MSGSYVNVNGADWDLRVDVSLSADGSRDIENALANLGGVLDEKQIKRAIYAARSRSLKAAQELGAKLAREEYTAKKSKIKNRFKGTMLNDGAQAGVRFTGFPGLNLIHFLARPNKPDAPRPKKGVTVKVKRDGGRYVPPGKKPGGSKPFIAPIYKNRPELGIFVRYGKERNMLYGPSPIQALQSPERQEKIRDRIAEIFEKRLVHELDVRLQGIVG